jgi:hypothetical protein
MKTQFTTKDNVEGFGTLVAYDATVLATFCPLCWQTTSQHTENCDYDYPQNDLPIRVWAGYNYEWEDVLVQDIEIQLHDYDNWSTIQLWELAEILDSCLQSPGCYDLRTLSDSAINHHAEWKKEDDLSYVDYQDDSEPYRTPYGDLNY